MHEPSLMQVDRVATQYSYLVRIINPEQKAKFVTKVWHDVSEKFVSVDHLKQMLVSTFKEKLPPLSELECGYLEKRNGKRWIEDSKDLDAMYKGLNENDEITLWCEGKQCEDARRKSGRKRKSEDGESSEDPPSKRCATKQLKSTRLYKNCGRFMERNGVCHIIDCGPE